MIPDIPLLYISSPQLHDGNSAQGLYGNAPPERGTFLKLEVYERVGGISRVEVYEKVGISRRIGKGRENTS